MQPVQLNGSYYWTHIQTKMCCFYCFGIISKGIIQRKKRDKYSKAASLLCCLEPGILVNVWIYFKEGIIGPDVCKLNIDCFHCSTVLQVIPCDFIIIFSLSVMPGLLHCMFSPKTHTHANLVSN